MRDNHCNDVTKKNAFRKQRLLRDWYIQRVTERETDQEHGFFERYQTILEEVQLKHHATCQYHD